MANFQNDYDPSSKAQMQDPKTGAWKLAIEAKAARAKFAAETFGKSQDDKALTAVATDISGDSDMVQKYLSPLVELIRAAKDVEGLKQAVPLIQDMMKYAQMDDTSLTKKEKEHIQKRGQQLLENISQRTSFLGRVRSSYQKISKSSIRTDVADTFNNGTYGLLGNLASAALRPKKDKDAAQQAAATARASVLGQVVDHQVRDLRADDITPPKEEKAADVPELAKKVGRKIEKAPAEEPMKAVASKVSKDKDSATLTAILGTDKSILHEVQQLNAIGQKQLTLEESDLDAKERTKAEGVGVSHNTPTTEKDTTPVKPGILGRVGNLLGDLGHGLLETIKPMAGLLGPAFAVAAAGIAGWKIGTWLDDLSGHTMSNAVQKFAESLNPEIKAQPKAALQAEIKLAEDRSHHAVANLTDARQINEEFAKLARVGHAPGQTPPPAPLDANRLPETGSLMGPHVAASPTPLDANRLPETGNLAGQRQVASKVNKEIKPLPMHMSEDGIRKLAKREGFTSKPKWDVNGWSIGYGDHHYKGVPLGNDRSNPPQVTMTPEEGLEQLRARVTDYEPYVNKHLTHRIDQSQFDSLVSVAYNSPVSAVGLTKRVNQGETLHKADFQASGTVKGKIDKGLQERRGGEFVQFMADVSPNRSAAAVNQAGGGGATVNSTTLNAPVTTVTHNGGSSNSFVINPISAQNPHASYQSTNGANRP